jgi:hypothetical protein
MFLTGKITLNVYQDSAQTPAPLLNIPSVAQAFQSSVVTGVQTSTVSVAASGTQAITLNGVGTVTGVFLYSDTSNVNVNINGLGNMVLHSGVPGFMPLTVSSLSINNASAAATNVTVILLAD